jgi:opacity protein-like surface antigen
LARKVIGVWLWLLLGAVLYGGNDLGEKRFLGVELGAAQIQGAVYLNIMDPSSFEQFYEGSDMTFGLRFGAENDSYRTTLLFDYYNNEEEDQTVQLGLLTIDYFVTSQEAASMTIKPFVGLNLGYLRYEATLVDDSDFVYGGEVGLSAGVSDSIGIDLSYRYSWTFGSESMDHFAVLMLGVNYLY